MLSRQGILKAIKEKRIRVTPFEKGSVGACSIDLKLGNEFKVFEDGNVLEVNEAATAPGRKVWLEAGEHLELQPGQFVLGVTKEKLVLSKDLSGQITGRSRFARLGLMVHVSSNLIQPGVENVQVLEIVNLSPSVLRLKPGVRVCQVTFHELSSPAEYRGKYKKQKGL